MDRSQHIFDLRMTRRGLLSKAGLAGIGFASGWLALPNDAEALMCPCDTWNCGMISPGAWMNGGRTIAVTCTIFADGDVNVPFRIRATQSSSGTSTAQAGDLVVERTGTIKTTVPTGPMIWTPWAVDIEAPEGQTFSKDPVHFECWLEPPTLPDFNFEIVLPLVEIGDNEYFRRTWMRTDKPVLDGAVSRTWMWGPSTYTESMTEEYAEAPGGQRVVQYYDKSRMEITHPDADSSSIWYVTNGLLVNELITGQVQVGDTSFQSRNPAEVNVAGDFDDPNGPTYATFGSVLDSSPLAIGTSLTQRIDRAGNVTDDPTLSEFSSTIATIDDVTNHAIPAEFWGFMTSEGTIFDSGELVTDKLFVDPYYATGRPITEAYWSDVLVGGTSKLVLMQCFERRCLTYTPDNPDGWKVEAGNVGQHYYAWRYNQL